MNDHNNPVDAMHADMDAATHEEPAEAQAAPDQAVIDTVIKNHVISAMGAGLIPVPGVDIAGVVAIQLRLVQRLSEEYGVTFRENVAKGAVLALVGGLVPATLAGSLVSALKFIPGFGSVAGAAGMSVLGGAMTYAVGRVFNQHLASGGTLLDFDAAKMRDMLKREFEAGKKLAMSWRPGKSETPAEAPADHTPHAAS